MTPQCFLLTAGYPCRLLLQQILGSSKHSLLTGNVFQMCYCFLLLQGKMFAGLLVFALSVSVTLLHAQTSCPPGWFQERKSCYFTGERFNGQTWYSSAAFCKAFGGHLVELNDKEELEYINGVAKTISWVDGPWIGIIRPWGDNRWVLPSLRAESDDKDLNQLIEAIAKDSSHDCCGVDRRGKNFGFWRCRNGGSPFCEIDLQ